MKTTILGTEFPLIQAPMNWVTDAKLVAAVNNAGGLGVLGTNAGQTTISSDPIEVKKRMKIEIEKTSELTTKPFGINILTPNRNQRIQEAPFTKVLLDSAFESGIHYFVVVGYAHQEIFNLIKQHNGFIIFRPLTPTVKEAILGEQLGADIIVATGHDEGGVLPNNELGTFTIIPEITDVVSIPVFAAGGINDRRTVKAAIALGAKGVYIGTRFLASKEAPVSQNVKELIVKSQSADTIMVSGNQRAIATKRAQELADFYQNNNDTNASNALISKDGGLRSAMRLGNLNKGIITVNNGLGTIKSIDSVKEIISDLFI